MNAQIEILRGARAGEHLSFAQRTISVGRAPTSDLRFDPVADRAVSIHHALFLYEDGAWTIRDMGSRNGTFLNGQRTDGDARVSDADRISFGEHGPLIEFRTSFVRDPRAGGAHGSERPDPLRPGQRGRRLRAVPVGLALASALAAALYLGLRQSDVRGRERASQHVRMDSIVRVRDRTVEALEEELAGLRQSLARSEAVVAELSAALRRAEAAGEAPRARELERDLAAASAVLQRQQQAAALDFRGLQRASRPAVARIYVEYADGRVATATAFAVRPDASLVTSRHVVQENAGAAPRRLAVQFSDSEQVWPARLLAVSDAVDLAVVKVDNILGDVPTVRGFNQRPDTLAPGSPVMLIGYSLGGEAGGGSSRRPSLARPILAAGVLRSVSPGRVEVQGYGAVGASGSPILDAAGEVVGVVYGGRERMLVAVPAPAAARLVAALP